MTNRERALNLLRHQPVDRMPAVHFGYWDELLIEWADQGKIPRDLCRNNWDCSEEALALDKIVGWDFNWVRTYGWPNDLNPPFEQKVLETRPNGDQVIQNGRGALELIHPGNTSIPSEVDYQIKDRDAFETLYLPRMQFTEKTVDLDFFHRFNKDVRAKVDDPVGILAGSAIGCIRDMASVIGMSYLIYDEDETLFADFVNAWGDYQYKYCEAILQTGATFDFAHYWEDICFNTGPLIAPELFRDLFGPIYRKRNELCRSYGIELISLDSDGKCDALMPVWHDVGINVMFPLEVGTWGDQFLPMRRRFGKSMRGIGAMDKRVFLADKAAVDLELERLRRLIGEGDGGLIPCPDHRLAPGSKFELVQYYAEEIKKISP